MTWPELLKEHQEKVAAAVGDAIEAGVQVVFYYAAGDGDHDVVIEPEDIVTRLAP